MLDAISKIVPGSGRARRTLMRAEIFAIGRIGASARISSAERALVRVLQEPKVERILLDLLSNASMPGQLYALLGLQYLNHKNLQHSLANYRESNDKVMTQTGCLRVVQPVRNLIMRIQDGTYLSLLGGTQKG